MTFHMDRPQAPEPGSVAPVISLASRAILACALAAGSYSLNTYAAASTQPVRHVVRFEEMSLAQYNAATTTISGVAPIPLKRHENGRARLDVDSAQAKAYVAYLQAQQTRHFADIAAVLGRTPTQAYSMQHAVNAQVLLLTADEAQRLAHIPGIAAVEPDRPLELSSDIGAGFTGAASDWWGASAGQDSIFARSFDNTGGYRGDGVVVGEIDTGYNSLSPSFQATDVNAYRITNPLGHGHYLGQCNVARISLGGCNDKIIGVYDEVDLTSGASNPVFTVEDPLGHGSHTASTAAGNLRSASVSGYTSLISGVVPHANLIIYRACSPDPYVGCSFAAIVASIDQAIADGVVDALNYSISGGTSPWSDSIALAFLSAADAGIFVSAAAGNTTSSMPEQIPGTVMNQEPWIATAAAGTHNGGALVQQTTVVRAVIQADELAGFSLLGPVPFNVIKPDLQSPGVHILAAINNDGTTNGPTNVGMRDGTSFATAHLTGSGALLLGQHPDWTPLEAKSALMMTAKETGLTKADGTTPSGYFDRGSGRLQDFPASKTGLVLNETAANFANANPAAGGDPATLNLASMQRWSCKPSCSFSRTFRSTQNHTVTWTARVNAGPSPGFSSVSINPSKFSVPALASSGPIAFNVDTHALAADDKYHFAEVVLTADDTKLPQLHLPVAVGAPIN